MKIKLLPIAFALAFFACTKAPEPPTSPPKPKTGDASSPAATQPVAQKSDTAHETGIAWRKGDVDAAFAQARADNKPVFLYWGAVWCPPCNQVKATIFNRQDFIERSRLFVPVYVDGDSPSAQRLGARFKVSGYPTMILFKPDGGEITRLPGEADVEQYMRVLQMGMNGARPVKDTLSAALDKRGNAAARLSAEDWRMLAYYSWDTDEQQIVPKDKVPSTLANLARSCPPDQHDTSARLELKALAAAAGAKGAKPRDDKPAEDRVIQVLGDAKFARENFDVIVYSVGEIVGYITLPKSADRSRLASTWNAALDLLIADRSLSTADRLAALGAKIELARLDTPKAAALPDALQNAVRDQVADADRETSDPYARQSVISAAADVLAQAGLMDESNALLKSELTRSHSPYYFMLGLAANAKKRGDKAAALDWEEKAYTAADGPATRLQWGAHYVNALVELAPQDVARIEKAAQSVIGELDPTPDTFYARNGRSLERMGKKLVAWNKDKQHEGALNRIRAQMASVCAKLPAADPARDTCNAVLNTANVSKA
jgi:thioredoxin-related protein